MTGRRTYDCPECRRLFGGVAAYDRHFDRRRDRCKTDAHLRRLGIWPDEDGVWRREQIDRQPPLFDKRSIPRVAKRTRRAKALADAHVRAAQRGERDESDAPEPAPCLVGMAS